MRTVPHLVYHVLIILLSAAIAVSLPFTVSYLARKTILFWTFVENEQLFLVSVEIATAVALVLLLNHIARSRRDGRLARMARAAGLALAAPAHGYFARKRMKELKERSGLGRDVMLIGSTGYRTFVDPAGDLHGVLQHCREARIMLLDPLREGAIARARSIPDPEVSPEALREQIIRSIDFLKGLRSAGKSIRLKLYQDAPLLKIALLGDHAILRHYHAGLHVDDMPEFAFRHGHDPGSLYNPLYQYFLLRWRDPAVPEYDLETDELVYRDRNGSEMRRERFNDVTMATEDEFRRTEPELAAVA